MAARNYDKTQYARTQQGSAILNTANATTQTLIAAPAAGLFADIFALIFYNGTSSNASVQLSDGTKTYTFGAGANSQSVAWGLPVNSPIMATNPNSAWTCNTNSASSITVEAFFVLNTQ
jgi:hypothetical protein